MNRYAVAAGMTRVPQCNGTPSRRSEARISMPSRRKSGALRNMCQVWRDAAATPGSGHYGHGRHAAGHQFTGKLQVQRVGAADQRGLPGRRAGRAAASARRLWSLRRAACTSV
jgi:hypothetical protein